MKNSLLLSLTFALNFTAWGQSPGMYTTDHHIEVRFTDLRAGDVILGHHFGDKQYTVDTAQVNENGVVVFEGSDDTLRYGVYLIYIPGSKYFDFLFAEPEVILETTLEDPVGDMNVIKSDENKIFFHYLQYLDTQQQAAEGINAHMDEASRSDSIRLDEELKELSDQVNSYMDEVVSSYPGSLAANTININRNVQVPDAPTDENGKVINENWQYYYYRAHYWDHVDLSDERLLYSPWLAPMIKKYITDFTIQTPDSIIPAADHVVSLTKGNKETFRFVVNWITNYYELSPLMAGESVFVHMVNSYYTEEQAWWVDEDLLARIQERASILEPVLVGKKIPNLQLADINGATQDLHQAAGEYIIIVFYDPSSEQVTESIATIEATRADHVDDQVEVWGVALNIDNEPYSNWNTFVEEHSMNEWVNISNLEGGDRIKETFGVNGNPWILVVNQEKEIILRRFGAKQVQEVLPRVIEDYNRD